MMMLAKTSRASVETCFFLQEIEEEWNCNKKTWWENCIGKSNQKYIKRVEKNESKMNLSIKILSL